MKIAICISGYMRSYRVTVESLKENILANHDCDIFIAASNVKGNRMYRKKNFYISKMYNDGIDYLEEIIIEENIRKIYGENLKDVIVHPYTKNDHFLNIPKKAERKQSNGIKMVKRNMHMYFYLKESYRLCKEYAEKNDIKYDIVIRVRPDMLFMNEINLKKSMSIHVPECYVDEFDVVVDGVTDYFAYGPPSKMEIYLSIYDSLKKYLSDGVDISSRQKLMKYHMEKNGIQIKNVDLEYELLKTPDKYNGKHLILDIVKPDIEEDSDEEDEL